MYPQQKSSIQKLLDDNSQLILLIIDLQSKGKQNECLEHQRTLHRNLNYLIQFDSSLSYHSNNLPPPDIFIQTQSLSINGQSDQIYRTQTNSPTPSNILNQSPQNLYLSSTSNNSINKPSIPQQRSSYPIQQNNYGQYTIHSQQSNSSTNTQNIVSNQQIGYNNYSEPQMYHSQQNYLVQQQWPNQTQMSISQQQYSSSYPQQT